jgi:hypothetical protein
MSKVEGLTDRPCSKNDNWQTARVATKETTLATIEGPSVRGVDVKHRIRAASSAAAMARVSTCEGVSKFLPPPLLSNNPQL